MMSRETWSAVDDYFTELLVAADPALDAALEASDAAGLPPINVSSSQGKLLYLLALAAGARNILEIGTLGGYSTIWLARALSPGGRLVTLEFVASHAKVAQANIARAGLADVVEVRIGRATDSLGQMVSEGDGPFDLIFIDADKEGYADYLEWSLKLSRVGTVIIADNVVRNGEVADRRTDNVRVQGIQRFTELLATKPNASAVAVPTVGSKGFDGFVLAVVTDPSSP
jgi:predicted O-methyltransferase YrrM